MLISIFQVQYNLFGRFMSPNTKDSKTDNNGYFICREVEENYQRQVTSQQGKGKPLNKFFRWQYNITHTHTHAYKCTDI